MKQKIVVNVSMPCDKCRSKALQTVSRIKGLISVAIEGPERDRVVVVGEGIDAELLLKKLRKKVGVANIVTVEEIKPPPAKETKPPPPPAPEKKPQTGQHAIIQYPPLPYPPYLYECYPVRDSDMSCIIM